MSGGKPAVVSKVDESTVKFSFSAPHALFLQALAHPRGGEMVAYPRHYLKQFIPKYNPNIDSLVKSEGVKDWVALFKSKYGTPGTLDDQTRWQHPEVPTLNPWIMIDTYGKSPIVKAVRNPYYWKIDPAGNQLPYIDMIEFTIEDDAKKITEMAVSGKLDMQDRHVGNSMLTLTESRPLIEANQTQGGYHLFKTVFATMNTMILSFNLNHKDPVLKEIFNNKDFRVGLSYAIDRQKIIKTMFDGRGSPYQAAPRPESPFYDKEMAEQYTEYSVAKANDHLDKAGISKKDSVGYRLRPDGKRLSFTVDWGDPKTLGMIQADWKAVGIDMKIGNTSDRTAYYTKKNNKDTDVSVWTGDGGIDVIQEPRYYFPFNDESNYAIGWAYWFFAPQNKLAEEPPQITKDQMALYRKLSETPDTEKQNEYMKEILKMAKDQFYVIGISLPVDGFGVVKNTFRNVPEAMPAGYVYPNPAPTNPPQYFIEK
jgi:peptide/nickel transport system substrate-binding protein